MKRICLGVLCLLLALAACGAPEEEGEYSLYFLPTSYAAGPALTAQAFSPDPDRPVEEALIAALLSGPEDKALLTSPFPGGVSLRSWSVREGLMHINLSEQYGGLSGMALTLADYSIALTLCQLPHVEGVSITVENDPMPFRYRQVLTAEDVILTDLPQDLEMTE